MKLINSDVAGATLNLASIYANLLEQKKVFA